MEDVPTTVKTECVLTDELRSVNRKSVPTNNSLVYSRTTVNTEGVLTNDSQHWRGTHERHSTRRYTREPHSTRELYPCSTRTTVITTGPANDNRHGRCTHAQHGVCTTNNTGGVLRTTVSTGGVLAHNLTREVYHTQQSTSQQGKCIRAQYRKV